MGRILQKKKRKSSIPKASRKAKSKKLHLSNPIIAANWDSRQTLTQNYRRLGLTTKLNKASGGAERVVLGSRNADHIPGKHQGPEAEAEIRKQGYVGSASKVNDKLVIEKGLATEVNIEEARVRRDPDTGGIMKVLDSPWQHRRPNPLNDPLNDLDDDDDNDEDNDNEAGGDTPMLDPFLHVPQARPDDSDVVRALEEKAANGRRKEPRKQSTREKEWLERLVDRHGEDYGAMFRDMRLNPLQRSKGDIKRRVEKFLAQRRD